MANIYSQVMDATDIKATTTIHNLAKGCELRGNMYLCNRLRELESIMEDCWNAADIALEDEQRHCIRHDDI
jgi:hypothetical protein